MTEETETELQERFEKARGIAETHLEQAIKAGGDLGPFVAFAMIEAAVNEAAEAVDDIDELVEMLRDLADQIEEETEEEGEEPEA